MAGSQDDEPVDGSGTETVDVGSTRRPWAAYVLVAILVLAAAGVGLHRLVAGGAPQRSAPHASALQTSAPRSTTATDRAVPRTAAGPQIGYDRVAAAGAEENRCAQTGSVLAVRPGHSRAALLPMHVVSFCRAPTDQSVVLREAGGSFGKGVAVVSFPQISPQIDGAPIPVLSTHDGKHGYWTATSVTWKVAGGVFVTVVGDLPRAQLARVARATTQSQVHGLVVAAVPGLARTSSAGYGQSSTFEAEYSASALGLGRALGGAKTINVSVLTGSGLEQGIFRHPAPEVLSRILIHGQPSALLRYGRSGLLVGWAVPPSAEATIVCNHCASTAQVEQALIRVARTSELYALALPPPGRH